MHYYLQLTTVGRVMGFQASPLPITNEDAGSTAILEIPDNNPSLLGYRYLGTVTPGVTVLDADYQSQFEAPPAPGCLWDGDKWDCPDDPAAQ